MYNTIVIDPPWPVKKILRKARPNQGESLDYSTMSLVEISELPILSFTNPGSLLFLWVTNGKVENRPCMDAGFDLIAKWGFTYYTIITWDKSTGVCPFGPIQITTEHAIMAYRSPAPFRNLPMGTMKTLIRETTKKHSRKPDIFYESLAWTLEPRLDMFAREERPGWDGWGDEYKVV